MRNREWVHVKYAVPGRTMRVFQAFLPRGGTGARTQLLREISPEKECVSPFLVGAYEDVTKTEPSNSRSDI